MFATVKAILQRRAPQLSKYKIEGDDADYIGLGQAGTRVYRCVDKESGKLHAIKVISKKVADTKKINDIRREAAVMRELGKVPHKGLVQIVDYFEDKGSNTGNMYIVMELMQGGELFEQIANRGSFTEHEACQVVVQVAEGLQHMHSHGYMHRDLKPENLLCAAKDSLDCIKICDFGMTKRVQNSTATTPCGTVTYVAPEVIIMKGDDMSRRGYGNKADVWSLGVILYVLLSGRPPFYDNTPNGTMNRIRRGDFGFPAAEWDYVSADAKQLITKCLSTNPADRYSINEFLAHPWIAKARSVPILESPRLQSPVVLREASLPINEFFKLLMPRLSLSSSPKPVLLSWDHVPADVPREENFHFYEWTVGEAGLKYEVPGYYHSIRTVKFGAGTGLWCVAWNDELGCDVALRKLSKVGTDPDMCYRLCQEQTILQQLRHENIHALLDGFVGPSEDVYYAYEMYDYTLRELLVDRNVPQEEIQLMTCYMFRGLNAIHESGLIHHDIRPSSIFVNMSFNKVCALKIGDFSKARVRPHKAHTFSSDCRQYRAPELLLDAYTYDQKVDVWSAGCVLAEMQIRKPIFPGGRKEGELMDSIVLFLGTPPLELLTDQFRCDALTCDQYANSEVKHLAKSFTKRFPSASPEFVDLMKSLLHYDPTKRPSAASVLQHAYISRFNRNEQQSEPTVIFGDDFDERPRKIKWKLQLYQMLDAFHQDASETRPLALGDDDDDWNSSPQVPDVAALNLNDKENVDADEDSFVDYYSDDDA